MLIHGDRYFQELRRMLAEAKQASLAVAFWGDGAERLFAEWRGESLRVICNLSMGGTNPKAIAQLQQLPGAEVRQLSDLHAKLVLTDDKLVVGSANISTNGLGLEKNEVAGWRETGLLSEEPQHLKSANAWFDVQWQAAQEIKAADLEAAGAGWQRRRGRRPRIGNDTSFMTMSADTLRDRPVYFAIYRQYASKEAREALKNEKAVARANGQLEWVSGLDVFEAWEEGDLPKDHDAAVIQIYWGRRGAMAIHSVVRPVPELARTYKKSDDVAPTRLDFFVNRAKDDLWFLGKADRERLKVDVQAWVEQLGIKVGEGRCIPAHEWRQWQEQQNARRSRS
jgi:hypothetical protein